MTATWRRWSGAQRLAARWDDWEAAGLIPTEEIPPGHRRDQRDGLLRYGISTGCDVHAAPVARSSDADRNPEPLKPAILAELGPERGRAVVTYLQFAIDKGLDYNSRQTRWEFTRGVVKGTFSRHDFSLKWTFGEMIFTGPNSGAAWGCRKWWMPTRASPTGGAASPPPRASAPDHPQRHGAASAGGGRWLGRSGLHGPALLQQCAVRRTVGFLLCLAAAHPARPLSRSLRSAPDRQAIGGHRQSVPRRRTRGRPSNTNA
jgi:hypothetical protein